MFRITWVVSEQAWSAAEAEIGSGLPGCLDDVECTAHYRFFGMVDLYDGERRSFNLLKEGAAVSLVDFAYQMMTILDSLKDGSAQEQRLDFSDDDIQIDVRTAQGGLVDISTNLDPATRLRTTLAEFVEGVNTFLQSFALEIRRRLPHLLDWKSFGNLRRVLI